MEAKYLNPIIQKISRGEVVQEVQAHVSQTSKLGWITHFDEPISFNEGDYFRFKADAPDVKA